MTAPVGQPSMLGTMQPIQLLIRDMLIHGQRLHSESLVVSIRESETTRLTFAQVGTRAERLAKLLADLGVGRGDRVGTLLWNSHEHLECYLAVPSMGAVLHTLNLRLHHDQLTFVMNHAEDKVVIVDTSLLPLLEAILPQLTTLEHIVLVGEGSTLDALGSVPVHDYESALGAFASGFAWPDLDENEAAAMCYTSGTTGDPKGVVYSHRSTYLHALASAMGNVFGLVERDKVLPIVPMFHANAWGLPYAAWFAGADLILPGSRLQPAPLATLIQRERVTVAGAVPTVWNDLLSCAREHRSDLSSLRLVPCGGSAVPPSLINDFKREFDVPILQVWGMTETSPVAAVARPHRDAALDEDLAWRSKTGRPVAGVELRIVDDEGLALPWDGDAVGEVQVRGPWITGAYYRNPDADRFVDGWLRTGDVATVDQQGYVQITDRTKDVVKSGGEWISSVQLETMLMGHPDVHEAAVIAIPDDRWQERPLACLVPVPGSSLKPDELRGFLDGQVPSWWIPERWVVVEEIPKTSVGKFDKKVLRRRYHEGLLDDRRASSRSSP